MLSIEEEPGTEDAHSRNAHAPIFFLGGGKGRRRGISSPGKIALATSSFRAA